MSKFVRSIALPQAASHKRQWPVWTMLKWTIFLVSAYFVYRYIFQDDQLARIFQHSRSLLTDGRQLLLLSAACALVIFNWGFEAYKWQVLLRKFQSFTLFTSLKAVIAGTSVSLWIPNRAGEYLGRVLFLRQDKRITGILATLVGSVAQVMVTLILGIFGLVYYTYYAPISKMLWLALILLGGVTIAVLLILYFSINKLRHLTPRKKWARFLRKYMLVYAYYSETDLLEVLLVSLQRYMVFSLQYYLLLRFYGLDLSFITLYSTITLIYLVQTAIPTNTLTELGIRGLSSSLFLQYTPDVAPAVAATYSLWVINLMVPAVTGLVIMLFTRYKQKLRATE